MNGWVKGLLASSGVAVLGLTAGYVVEPRRAAFAYLFAYVWLASMVVGSLFFLAIAHTTGASWMVVVRRRAEDVAGVAPALLPLFVPVALTLPIVFPWAAPEPGWTPALRDAIVSKRAFLSPTFFLLRAALYLVSWASVAELLRRRSRKQDESSSPVHVERLRQTAAVTLPWLAFTMTFAAFDWVMSLDPTWSSNVLGIYLFSGGFGAACGLVSTLALGDLSSHVHATTPQHGHALGRLLLTFVIFWTYIAFAQFLLMWIADVPREVPWIARRTEGPWASFAIALTLTHFVLPFGALLSRDIKLRPRWVAGLGGWLVFAHALDVYWLIMPEETPSPSPSWVDVSALLLLGSAAVLMGVLRARGEAEVPAKDPRLERGLAYEATP
jgi:hypothetical protein